LFGKEERLNTKFKSILKGVGIFSFGLVAGALLIESLEIYLRPTYRQVIRTNLKVEQEFLASRAARENKSFEAAFHRWATVNAESEEGFHVFREKDNRLDDNPYLTLFALLSLKWMWPPDSIERGGKLVEGMDRGKLAIALERIGQQEDAVKQWEISKQLQQGQSLEAVKQSSHSILDLENTDLHRQAEDAVLGKMKK
jgi:hypothetical protein